MNSTTRLATLTVILKALTSRGLLSPTALFYDIPLAWHLWGPYQQSGFGNVAELLLAVCIWCYRNTLHFATNLASSFRTFCRGLAHWLLWFYVLDTRRFWDRVTGLSSTELYCVLVLTTKRLLVRGVVSGCDLIHQLIPFCNLDFIFAVCLSRKLALEGVAQTHFKSRFRFLWRVLSVCPIQISMLFVS